MNKIVSGVLVALLLLMTGKINGTPPAPPQMDTPEAEPTGENLPPREEGAAISRLQIQVGGREFSLTLEDNDAAKALVELLPLTITMAELNGNEKFYNLDGDLPTQAEHPGRIQAGDFMLYGDNCLVLFYESFSTSYGYTPLGRLEDPTGLAEAVRGGDVELTLSAQG